VAVVALLAGAAAAVGCEEDSESTSDTQQDDTGGESTDEGGEDNGGEGQPDTPPTEAQALLDWLESGAYQGWTAEGAPHPSSGPHYGDVRVYVNPALAASLEAGATSHPVGAAAVKELFGDGNEPVGWSAMIRTSTSPNGGWYWYEVFEGAELAAGESEAVCTNCHAGGAGFIKSSWPF
jgi:hypothetical protein